MLDEQFGAKLNVQEDEDGFIFLVLDDKNLVYFREKYFEFNSALLEYVDDKSEQLLKRFLPLRLWLGNKHVHTSLLR